MDTRKIPVFCYWNGCIKDGPDGPFYQGSSPRVIRVESKTNLPKLLDDLHRVTGFEKGKFQIEMIGRYPSVVQQSMVKYMRLPVVDDCSLETMLEVPSYHSSISSVELYLEVKPMVSDEGVGPVSNLSPLANHEARKRSRKDDANVDAAVNANVRNTDDVNCGNNEAAQKDSKMKKPGPSKGLNNSVSKPLIFSSSWLVERELHVGMLFRDQEELKKAVKLHSDRMHREYNMYDYPYKDTFEFRCKKLCGWLLNAAKTNGNGFEITGHRGPHTCKPANVGSDFLAGELESLIRTQPSLSIAELVKWMKEEFGCTVSFGNMWTAKTKAITSILGDLDKSFSVLPKFMAPLCSSNKMLLDWQYDIFPDPKDASFRSVFWALYQSIKGFTHCIPLIMVDTIDLSGKYAGKLLVAAGIDAESRIFPLAFAIITQESLSADSWRWFFACIREKVTQREGICLITSLDPDIVAVVNEPECQWAQHRFCLSHLCLKFYDVFRNNLMTELVYKGGSTGYISSFDYCLKKIQEMNPEARKWLDKIPPHQWSLAHDDGGVRFGYVNTNTIFTAYSFINEARDLPITTCILLIFDHLAEYFKYGRNESLKNRGELYGKYVMKRFEEHKVASRKHDVLPLDPSGVRFQVTDVGNNRYVVHLSDRACTCRILQLCKYPCSHVLAVCRRMNSDHLQYVNDYYSTWNYFRAYAGEFNPLPGVSDWPEVCEVLRLFPPGSRPASVFRPVTTAPPRNELAKASKKKA